MENKEIIKVDIELLNNMVNIITNIKKEDKQTIAGLLIDMYRRGYEQKEEDMYNIVTRNVDNTFKDYSRPSSTWHWHLAGAQLERNARLRLITCQTETEVSKLENK